MDAGRRVAFPGASRAVDPPVPGCFAARGTDFPATAGFWRAGTVRHPLSTYRSQMRPSC